MLFVVCDTWLEHQKTSISRIFTHMNKNWSSLNKGKTYKRIFKKKKGTKGLVKQKSDDEVEPVYDSAVLQIEGWQQELWELFSLKKITSIKTFHSGDTEEQNRHFRERVSKLILHNFTDKTQLPYS